MASRSLTLYTGVTDSIYRRALEHKNGKIDGFTKRYKINRLVYYETFKYIGNAIAREKQVKAWTRAKRIALIKSLNPTWQDLADGWGEKVEMQIPHFVRDDKSVENDGLKINKRHSRSPIKCARRKTRIEDHIWQRRLSLNPKSSQRNP
jgi:putative endonuclease